jgi:hypothetical protein
METQDGVTHGEGTGYTFAIVGVSLALVVTLIGASTIAALGHQVPKELWAIGGALGGALVGILVPSPRLASGGEATPAAAAYTTHNAAVEAARGKVAEIEKSAGAAPEQAAGAKEALQLVEQQAGELKHKLASMAIVASVNEGGQAHRAAADAVQLQRGAFETATKAAHNAPEDLKLRAAKEVHEAAHEAASKAAPAAAQREPGWFAAVKTITAEAKIFVPLILFAVALTLGVLLGLGAIHAQPCHPEEKSCAYYAGTTKQAANALIALASAAGGALLGVFATSPGASKAAKAPAG